MALRPTADHFIEALDLCRTLLLAGAVGPDDEAQVVSAIGDALYVAMRVPIERKRPVLEAASRVGAPVADVAQAQADRGGAGDARDGQGANGHSG